MLASYANYVYLCTDKNSLCGMTAAKQGGIFMQANKGGAIPTYRLHRVGALN